MASTQPPIQVAVGEVKPSQSGDANIQPETLVDVLVAGAIASDTICDYSPFKATPSPHPVPKTSNPSEISQSVGGVGRNVAVAAHYAGAKVALVSATANDLAGESLCHHMRELGMSTAFIRKLETASASTAQYVAVNDSRKDLVLAMADMAIFANPLLEQRSYWEDVLDSSRPKWIVVDGNWSAPIMSTIFDVARARKIPVALEPVSTAKSVTIWDKSHPSVKSQDCTPAQTLQLITPNQYELAAMHTTAREHGYFDSPKWWATIDSFGLSSSGTRDKFASTTTPEMVQQGIPQQCIQLLPYVPNIVTKLGSQGVLLTQVIRDDDLRLRDPDASQYVVSRCLDSTVPEIGGIYMRLFPPAANMVDEDVVSVNGIGDTMLGTIMAGLVSGHTLEQVLPVAQEAAVLSLKSKEAVSPQVKELASRIRGR